MNPKLVLLQPYPFERLRALFAATPPDPNKKPISLSIGEPKHKTPQLVVDALVANMSGLANYPTTAGSPELREAIAGWLRRRHELSALDAMSQVLPILGSREALFAFAQTVVDPSRVGAAVGMPNPFYQIYEGPRCLRARRPGASTVWPPTTSHPRGTTCPKPCGRARSCCTFARRTIRRAVSCRCRIGSWCSHWRTAMVSSSPPTSAIRKSTATKRLRRWDRWRPRRRSVAQTTRGSSRSAACRSDPTRRDCAQAT